MALDSGFNNEFVIYYDNAWSQLHGSEKWKNLIKNPPAALAKEPNSNTYSVWFSIPKNLQ